ncbi:MAG: lipoprotein of unknown function DUF4249 [Bacteroidetes bacterium HLUCCA01]|nr:MAG: lipoprotein of unknown function DUF4249 [Bacteroidetes bacterium HLUCCA01]
MKKTLLLLIGVAFIAGCDLYPQDDYTEQYVVDGWLTAMEPLPEIRLTRTGEISTVFDINERGVADAMISVSEVDPVTGDTVWSQLYRHKDSGFYEPVNTIRIVQPNTRYDLDISTARGDRITAKTVVPDTFSVISLNADRLPYQGPEQFELNLTRSVNPSRQSYYVFSAQILDTLNAELTPFYANFDDVDRSELFIVSSGIINESNSRQPGSDVVDLVYPWIGIAFYGSTRITAAAIDDNVYDFIRSAGTQLGGGTQSPGEIENIISNVEGGIGLFGSYSKVSVTVDIEKPVLQ